MKFVKKFSLTAAFLFCAVGSVQAQTWTPLVNQPQFAGDSMWVMTDGTVLVQDLNATDCWKLTPDKKGSYVNGTWTQIASMNFARLYYASGVLADGRLIVSGGEYNGASDDSEITATEIYDPVLNTWTVIPPPPGFPDVGDAPCCVLPNGNFMIGNNNVGFNYGLCDIYNPVTKTWAAAATKPNESNSEENWTLLPGGGAFLTQNNEEGQTTSEYLIAANQWVPTGSTVEPLVETSSIEIGPAILMPSGSVFVIGATGYTGIYEPNTKNVAIAGKWINGPALPNDQYGLTLGAKDAPAALLPNGHVIFAVGPVDGQFLDYDGPMTFLEFDGKSVKKVPPPNTVNTQFAPYIGRMLDLPNGQVMWTDGAGDAFVYSSPGSPSSSWAPSVTSVFPTVAGGGSYFITGKQFNGLSQAVGYGDDYTAATNYPLVRITNKATGDVQYCRTFNHSTMAVATGSALVATNFQVPSNIETGASTLEVVANGIPSKAVSILIDAAGSDVTNSITSKSSALTPSGGLYAGTVTITNSGTATIKAPISVLFNGLPKGVTLSNATGTHNGIPYITSTATQLKPNGSLTVSVQFSALSAASVTYSVQVHSGKF